MGTGTKYQTPAGFKPPRYCLECDGITHDYQYVAAEGIHICNKHPENWFAPIARDLNDSLVPEEFRRGE